MLINCLKLTKIVVNIRNTKCEYQHVRGKSTSTSIVSLETALLSYERKEGHHNKWWTASREAHSKRAELTSVCLSVCCMFVTSK